MDDMNEDEDKEEGEETKGKEGEKILCMYCMYFDSCNRTTIRNNRINVGRVYIYKIFCPSVYLCSFFVEELNWLGGWLVGCLGEFDLLRPWWFDGWLNIVVLW